MRVTQLCELAFILVLISFQASAQVLELDPESPRWGSPISITADPKAKVGRFQTRFYPNDLLYAQLITLHQGLERYSQVRMEWDGSRFVAGMTLPEEAELWGRLGRQDRVEVIAIEAHRHGSLAAEKILRTLYRERTGSEDGFQEYFISRLTGEK